MGFSKSREKIREAVLLMSELHLLDGGALDLGNRDSILRQPGTLLQLSHRVTQERGGLLALNTVDLDPKS